MSDDLRALLPAYLDMQIATAAISQAADEIEQLTKERDALRLDAERYRWLRANHLQVGPDAWIRTGADLEEAIDTAMKEKP